MKLQDRLWAFGWKVNPFTALYLKDPGETQARSLRCFQYERNDWDTVSPMVKSPAAAPEAGT